LVFAFLIQGFQCASAEMTTAKTAYAKNNYTTAVENLEIELNQNPTNEEAMMLLLRIKILQGKFLQAAKIVKDAETKLKNPKNLEQLPNYKNQLWVNSYNSGMTKYRSSLNSGNTQDLDSALFYFETGQTVRPEVLDFYYFNGFSFREKGDTAKAMESFAKYVSKLEPEMNFAKANQIFIDMEVQEGLNNAKLNSSASVDTLTNGDLIRIDITENDNDKIYLYSYNEAQSGFKIKGIRLNLPADWTQSEIRNFFEIKLDAYRILISHYYENDNKRKALEYCKKLQSLNPLDSEINNFVVQIFRDLGEEDAAKKELQELISKNPENKIYWVLQADLLANLDEFDKAISSYEKAIEIDKDYGIAYRNLGSSYKNRASKIQSAEKDKKDSLEALNEKYEIDTKKYYPDLEKSASAFQSALKTKDFKDNVIILSELAEIYHVTDKLDDLNKTIAILENLESRVPEDYKRDYYQNLLKIFSDRVSWAENNRDLPNRNQLVKMYKEKLSRVQLKL
jgi:tetratricopeptide (TPR) repeat protein